jgi:hypothetical protein
MCGIPSPGIVVWSGIAAGGPPASPVRSIIQACGEITPSITEKPACRCHRATARANGRLHGTLLGLPSIRAI